MKTTFRLKVSELDEDFVKSIKALFKKDREIEITISLQLLAAEAITNSFTRTHLPASQSV